MTEMSQRVVIVTGASGGLGRGTATVFARAGWNVVVAARSKAKLDGIARDLSGARGQVLPVPTDIADPEQVDAMVRHTLATFGRVDVLINNAAIDHPASIEELTVAQWNEVISVNLSGVFYAAKAAFPAMKAQGSGYIINISSVAGKRGWPNATAYCASKFALTGFTQALNGEGKPHNIRCAVIYPGGMDTTWHAERTPEFLEPEDVGRFLMHMVDQDPRFVVNEAVLTPIVEQGYP